MPDFFWDRKFFNYSWARLELPYFLCGNCRTAYVDRALVQNAVSLWRKTSRADKSISHKKACELAQNSLGESMRYKVEKLGYEIVRYYKK